MPGNNESAGKHLSGRTRQGDPWLSLAALGLKVTVEPTAA